MAIFIQIRKYKTVGQDEFYHVFRSSFNEQDLYISINHQTRILSFFYSPDDIQAFHVVDFNNLPEKFTSPANIDIKVYQRLISQAYRALTTNEFPEILDYCA